MIVTEGQRRFLERGQHVTITLPVERREDARCSRCRGGGERARCPTCGGTGLAPGTSSAEALIAPPEVGRAYRAQVVAFTRGMTVTVLRVERDGETWRVSIAPGDRTDPTLYLGRRFGYTTDVKRALPNEPPAVPEAFQRKVSKAADDAHRAKHPSSKPAADRDLAAKLEDALRDQLADTYLAWTPDEIALHSHVQGTPKEIRRRRRAMGLRAIDGYPKLTPADEDIVLRRLVRARKSEREIARALDVSRDKARRLVQTIEWEEQHRAA